MAKPDPAPAIDDTVKKTKTRKTAPANTTQGGLFEQNVVENNE